MNSDKLKINFIRYVTSNGIDFNGFYAQCQSCCLCVRLQTLQNHSAIQIDFTNCLIDCYANTNIGSNKYDVKIISQYFEYIECVMLWGCFFCEITRVIVVNYSIFGCSCW